MISVYLEGVEHGFYVASAQMTGTAGAPRVYSDEPGPPGLPTRPCAGLVIRRV
jgi:hypothetical protein